MRDQLPRLGRALQLGGIGLMLVFFVATAATAPAVHESRDDTAPGPLTVSAMGAAWDGSVTHYSPNGTQQWQLQDAGSYNGIQQLGDDRWLVAFTEHGLNSGCGDVDPECARTGVRIVDTSGAAPAVEWEWTQPVATGRNSEVHDAEVLPDGDVVVADMDHERILVVNRSTKTIDWEWQASEVYTPPDDPATTDWLHINDVDHIGEERFLVSVRNANQLLVLERASGVVEVINADRGGSDESCLRSGQLVDDGDARCGDPAVLNHQHNPQWLNESAVLVADSENDRVVELHERDGQWVVAWSLSSANGVPLDWPRDADRLANGNTLITDTRNARVVEVDNEGNVIYSQPVPEQAYEADVRGSEYPAGEPYNSSGAELGVSVGQPFEFVDQVYAVIRWSVPLPYWVTSWHVLVTLVGLLGLVYGTLARQLSRQNNERESEVTPDAAD